MIPTFMGNFEGFIISMNEVISDVVELVRELELELEVDGARAGCGGSSL